MYNKHLFYSSNLRKLFEEEQLARSDFSARYLKNFDLVRKQLPYLEPSDEVRSEVVSTKEAPANKMTA